MMDYLYGLLDSEELYRMPADIKNRFAKLTLSKKKQLRTSLESNLVRELLTDDSSESEADELNKIFKSPSSSLVSDEKNSNKILYKPKKLSILFDHDDPDETHCAEIEKAKVNKSKLIIQDEISHMVSMDMTENMEKLQFSFEEITKEKILDKNFAIDVLSQKVSNLDICSPVKDLSQMEKSLEKTQLVSVESERKSSSGVDINSGFPSLKIEAETLKKSDININSPSSKLRLEASFNKTALTTISLSSSEKSDEDFENLSDSDSSEDDEDEDVIVVSDSDDSVSNLGYPPKKTSDNTDNYSDRVSEIRPSGQTYLTNTLSNEKADRLEAFLNDLPTIGEPNNIENIQNSFSTQSADESNIYDSMPEEIVEVSETSTENELKNIDKDMKDENEKSLGIEFDKTTNDEQVNIDVDFPTIENDSPNFQDSKRTNESNKSNCASPLQNENSSSSSNYEYEQISVSAKFNIKIQINSQPNRCSKSSEKNSESNESQYTQESRQSEVFQENQKAIVPNSMVETLPEACNKKVSIENIDENAKQILTKLYGNQWQTPENIKKLDRKKNPKYHTNFISNNQNDRTMKSENFVSHAKMLMKSEATDDDSFLDKNVKTKDNLFKFPEVIKPLPITNSKLDKNSHDESSIADFSIFHKYIRNDLESTRLNMCNVFGKTMENQITEFKVPFSETKKANTKLNILNQLPQTEILEHTERTTRSGRRVKPVRWKKLLDSDNSADEYSDDSEADATYQAPSSLSLSSPVSFDGSYMTNSPSKIKNKITKKKRGLCKDGGGLVYLDLSNETVKVQAKCSYPPSSNGLPFNENLNSLLKTCTFQPRKQLEDTPSSLNIKRKLFTPRFGDEDEILPPDSPLRELVDDLQEIKLSIPLPSIFGMPINKKLESVKTGTPIFKIPTPSKRNDSPKPNNGNNFKSTNCTTPITSKTPKTPKSQNAKSNLIEEIPEHTPLNKYGFLKSLDVMVPKYRCHPDAVIYRDNYKSRKEELAQRLYKLYNDKIFKNELNVEIIWNKKLINTAGRCSNKKKGNLRSSVIELSEKVLTSGDRLRCTLIHELCHAATWIFNGEHGHGITWKTWAQKANVVFQELPKIGVCHSYDIEYKYTYKCLKCQAKSHAHSKSKKVENIRCAYCHGTIEILLNKKDKDGNIVSTPTKQPTGFAKFVKDNYKNFQKPNLKHGDIMKLLSNEFSALKVVDK